MRRWAGIPLSFLLVLGVLVPAWANQELHHGGRIFFPLWDVSTPNRLTFIILTREALNEGQAIVPTFVSTASGVLKRWEVLGTGSCIPRGNDGSSADVNRTDLGGTGDNPVFVDDVHLEYYGRSCDSANETVHMSCADIDLFLLASPDNSTRKPRRAFTGVAADGRGALDVHLIENSSADKTHRKLENSLMGHAIISDLAEGWAAVYPAAAAQAVSCPGCILIDGGTEVGYENYPMEVYLSWSFADLWPAPGGTLRNILSLWGPGLLPGENLSGTSINVDWKWWDGRERYKANNVVSHAIVRPLGGPSITGLDAPLDSAGFVVTNFTCNTASGNTIGVAENDGFSRDDGSTPPGTGCNPGNIASADTEHPSDNFESTGDVDAAGHSIQQSTSIGWWRFRLRPDGLPPELVGGVAHSGRGLVGVLLSTSGGTTPFFAVGDSWRLWHKEACGIAQSAETLGPLHHDPLLVEDHPFNDLVSLWNTYSRLTQDEVCNPVPPL